MEPLDPAHWPPLREHFVPDRPGPLIGLHAINTGVGSCWVDRWPRARAGIVFTGGNLTCWGDADALVPSDLGHIVHGLLREWDRVFIEARPGFETVIGRAVPGLLVWPRVILVHAREAGLARQAGGLLRRLLASDAVAVGHLDASIAWISDTRGGAAPLAASETAWGAFVDGRLVSVAVPYFVGDRHEDIGVVTDPGFRGRGLSPACAARVIADIRARGRIPGWSTSVDNRASRRVAEKLGFVWHRDDVLHIAGAPLPGAVAPDRRL
jgi:GNAT superfamily N-acetyltransferase